MNNHERASFFGVRRLVAAFVRQKYRYKFGVRRSSLRKTLVELGAG